MNDYEIWSNELKIERTIKALEENNMNGYYARTREDLIDKIKELVDEGAMVTCGGSETLFKTGVIDYLRSGRYDFLDRYKEGITREEVTEIFRQAFLADAYFVCNY